MVFFRADDVLDVVEGKQRFPFALDLRDSLCDHSLPLVHLPTRIVNACQRQQDRLLWKIRVLVQHVPEDGLRLRQPVFQAQHFSVEVVSMRGGVLLQPPFQPLRIFIVKEGVIELEESMLRTHQSWTQA